MSLHFPLDQLPVAPGSAVAIFGTNLGNGVYSATTIPLPMSLGGISVSINGIPAPLFYVSPTQINAQVPSTVAFSYGGFTTANVVVTSGSGASAPALVQVFEEGPGVFTASGTGCGQAAVLNIRPDGTMSPNSPANSAAPGDSIAVFGTGFGQTYFPPPDGSPPQGAKRLEFAGGFSMNGEAVRQLDYFGLAPDLVGVDQANLQIPADMREGCAVPLAIEGAYAMSPTVSISINSSRGQCVEPETESNGTIMLVKTIAAATGGDGETDTLSASFPSGPQLKRLVESQMPGTGYIANSIRFSAPARFCPVAGYEQLSAGPITVSGPNGSVTAATAPGSETGSPSYLQNLPPGFIAAGTYNISAAGSSTIGAFQGSVTLDSPIRITAVRPPTNISAGDAFTVQWAGGTSESVVRVSLVYRSFMTEYSSYGYTAASAGTYSFQPICSGNPVQSGGSGVFCSFGLPGLTEVVVEQMPARISTFLATGIAGDIHALWMYRYVVGLHSP